MFSNRIMGVFKLNAATFEDIEHDPAATSQAVMVVALVAVMSALGAGFSASITGSSFAGNFVSTLVWTFVGWILWSIVSYFVGTTLFGGQATVDEMLRVIGFAYAPQLLAIIPCIGGLIGAIWSLAAGFIAIRQGLDLDDLKAFLTILVGFVVYILGNFFISILLGGIGNLFG